MLDPPGLMPTNGNEGHIDWSFALFALLFHLSFVFLLVNFVLAIIVSSYMKVLDGLDELKVEQNILSDLLWVGVVACASFYNRWPSVHKVVHLLGSLKQKYVNPEDLLPAGFRNSASAKSFYDFYTRYDFLV